MNKLKQQKIPVAFNKEDVVKSAIEQGVIEDQFNWKLIREKDGLIKESKDIMWLEWNDEGRFKNRHTQPAIGRSLIMSPFNDFFTWQTTDIEEILEEKDGYIKFKTKNSVYELINIEKL